MKINRKRVFRAAINKKKLFKLKLIRCMSNPCGDERYEFALAANAASAVHVESSTQF